MAAAITNITFESVKEDILRVFERLQQKLDERKQVLMGQLLAIKEEVESSADITEMREKKEMWLANLPNNVMESERKHLEYILTDQIKDAKARRMAEKLNMVKLRCYTAKLEEGIAQISLVEDIPAYASRLAPVIKCGAMGSGLGEFISPGGICIDATNNVYVADRGNNRIQVLNKTGEYVNSFGTRNLKEPWGLAVTDQFVYVTDQLQHTIVQFARDGAFIRSTGSHGSGPPLAFNRPSGIDAYIDKLYVCDCMNNRIQVVDTSLKFIEEFRSNELYVPSDIHITAAAIHVLPQDGNIVHLYSNPGYAPLQVVKLIGQEYDISSHYFFTVDQLGNYLIGAMKEHHIRVFDNTGALRHIIGESHMKYPKGISVDSNNNIFCVTGAVNNKFQMF